MTNRNRMTMMMMTTTTMMMMMRRKRMMRKRRMRVATRRMRMRMRVRRMRSLHPIPGYHKKGLQLGPLHYPLPRPLHFKTVYSRLPDRAEMPCSSIWTDPYHVLTLLKLYLPYPILFQLTLLLPRLACPTF